jgi:hypothetical protein
MTTAAPSESPLSRQNLVVLGFPSLDPGFDRIEPVVEKAALSPSISYLAGKVSWARLVYARISAYSILDCSIEYKRLSVVWAFWQNKAKITNYFNRPSSVSPLRTSRA